MKITVEEKSKCCKKEEYPCMKIVPKDGMVVFFEGPEQGTVLRTDGHWKVGTYSKNWVESLFKPFHGKITLEQE